MNIINHRRLNEVISEGYRFEIGEYISDAFELIKKEAGLYIAFTLVAGIIGYFASMFGSILQFVIPPPIGPFIGSFAGEITAQFVKPPLYAGVLLATYKVFKYYQPLSTPPGLPGASDQGFNQRGPALEFGDFFKGFEYYTQLVLQGFMIIGIALLLLMPMLIVFSVLGGFEAYPYGANAFEGSDFIILGLTGLISFCGFIYVSAIYTFAPAFVIFGDMQAWEAMETSRKVVNQKFWTIFGFVFVLGLVVMAGFLVCCVGALFAIPVAQAAVLYAFKDVMALDDPAYNNPDDEILDHLVD